ncbi:MAG: DHH family phosphoesterase [Nitrososphaerota archaeon]
MMAISYIKSLIDEIRPRFVLLLCHQNADPDAVCSAFALAQLLERLRPKVKVEIAAPEGISKLSKALIGHIPLDVTAAKPAFKDADVVILLDTNTIQQLGEWGTSLKALSVPIVVIDHHAYHPETEKIATLCVCDENYSSTCEIVYSLFKELGLSPAKEEAEALFLGIAFDTKHFTLAHSATFKVISELIDAGVDVQESLPLLSRPIDISERMARLKACSRLRIMRINDWLIVFSHVGSYQASVARALVEMGAHVALVGGEKKDTIAVSMRSDREFYKKTGFHLGRDLAKPLGEYLHGMGGGHSTSAGLNGVGDFETAVKRSIKILRERLH